MGQELKEEYDRKVAKIKSKYEAPADSSSDDANNEPVLLASADESSDEKDALRRAKQNYKTQMQYQGSYPKEAQELKEEYDRKVAKIKSKYEDRADSSSNDANKEPLLLASADESSEEKDALRRAKQNYKTQMQYQGFYPKEAQELKDEYDRKVAKIKSKYEAPADSSSDDANNELLML